MHPLRGRGNGEARGDRAYAIATATKQGKSRVGSKSGAVERKQIDYRFIAPGQAGNPPACRGDLLNP
jgi:hypothetical protein